MFSSRVPRDLVPNRIARSVRARRAAGARLIDLTASNPTRVGLRYPTRWPAPLEAPGAPPYEPAPLGVRRARQAVAEDFHRRGVPMTADRIVLTASTSEAYGFLFKLLCDPGDAVLVPRPSYPLFEHLTRLDAVAAAPYDLVYDGTWRIDMASVDAALTHARAPRALLVVTPNNPTGSWLTPEDAAGLVERARSRSLALIADEVFADYHLQAAAPRVPSLVEQSDVLAFALGGLSKTCGLPQVKLAWMALGGAPPLVDAALERLEVVGDAYLNVSSPVQHAAPALLASGRAIREQIRDRLATNLGRLKRLVGDHPACQLLHLDAGWSAVVRVPAVRTEEELVVELVERDGVLVHPGYFFDFATEAYVVLSLLPEPGLFEQGAGAVLARAESGGGS